MVNFDQPLPAYLDRLCYEMKLHCAGNQSISKPLEGYLYFVVDIILGGKSPVGAYKRVEALQFFHVFKTILVVSLRRDEMLT